MYVHNYKIVGLLLFEKVFHLDEICLLYFILPFWLIDISVKSV